MQGLKGWLPVVIWMALIFAGSGDLLSAQRTSGFLGSLLHWLSPRLTDATAAALILIFRKAGHVTEYAILAALCWRALHGPFRGESRRWKWQQAAMAFGIAVAFAATDEFHQGFVPTRTGSAWDVVIDACGALLGLLAAWRIGLVQRRRAPAGREASVTSQRKRNS